MFAFVSIARKSRDEVSWLLGNARQDRVPGPGVLIMLAFAFDRGTAAGSGAGSRRTSFLLFLLCAAGCATPPLLLRTEHIISLRCCLRGFQLARRLPHR